MQVAGDAVSAAGLEPRDIDLIICQSFGGRFIVPGLAGFVHKRLGCRRNTPAWNVQDICASFLDGCQIATAMIKGRQEAANVLVMAVSALETGGWGTDPSHHVSAVMGDGAAAAIISAENLRAEFLAFNNDTYGEIYEPAVMAFDPPAHPDLIRGSKWVINKGGCGPHLTPEFDDLMATVLSDMVVESIGGVARKAGISPESIDLVVAHQAFSGLLDIWTRRLEEPACRDRAGARPGPSMATSEPSTCRSLCMICWRAKASRRVRYSRCSPPEVAVIRRRS